jgi:lysozyme
MKTSQNGKNFIQQFEGLRLSAYLCPVGKWTIGYGQTSIADRPVREDDKITLSEADELFEIALIPYENKVIQEIKVALNQHQFDALVSHTYNTGGSETLFALINQGAHKSEIQRWMEHSHITGRNVVLNGLIRRRKAESDLFFSLSFP